MSVLVASFFMRGRMGGTSDHSPTRNRATMFTFSEIHDAARTIESNSSNDEIRELADLIAMLSTRCEEDIQKKLIPHQHTNRRDVEAKLRGE